MIVPRREGATRTSVTDPAELARRDAVEGIEHQVAGALVDVAGKILLLRRPAGGFRGGTWEFPSGKVEPGEDLLSALHREVLEETGLTIDGITGYLGAFDYTHDSGRHIRQHTWSVTVGGSADVRLTEHDAYAWPEAHTWLEINDDPPVSREILTLVEAHLGARDV